MVLWWAVFLVLGIIFPSEPISAMSCMLLTVLIGWVGRRNNRRVRLFVIYASTSLVIWTGAGLARSECGHSIREQSVSSVPALSAARAKLVESLEGGRLSKRGRSFLAALLLAERESLDDEIRESYAYLGIAHFLALSGLHLGAIMIPIAWIAGLLPIRRTVREGIILSAIVIYTAITDFPPSLVRAAVLAFAFMIQRRFGRKTTLARSLALGAFALVVLDFDIVFDGGFQLSCAAVFAIALIAIPLLDMIGSRLPEGWMGRLLRIALAPALLTVSINVLTLPLVLLFFGRAPLLAPLFNLGAVLPVTAMLYLGLVYLAIPVDAVRALVAVPVNLLAGLLSELPVRLAYGRQPALYAGDVRWIAYAAGVLLIVISMRRDCPKRVAVFSIAAVLVAASLGGAGFPGGSAGRLRSGSHPAVERVTNRSVLLDEGNRILLLEGDIGRREAVRLVRRLWVRGIHRIGRLVICPARLWKRSGVYHLLARLEMDTVACSPYLVTYDARFAGFLAARGVNLATVARNDSITVGSTVVLIRAPLYPPPQGGGVSMKEAEISYEIVCDAAVRQNAN